MQAEMKALSNDIEELMGMVSTTGKGKGVQEAAIGSRLSNEVRLNYRKREILPGKCHDRP